MAGSVLLGIYDDVAPVADAIERIRRLGVPENRMTVMSAFPIHPEALGRPHSRTRLPLIAGIGALLGALTALIFVGGTQVLYPIRQGGQPLWPLPPQFIILFEVTMLGTMFATFIGLFLLGRFPVYGNPSNDPRIQAGYFGLSVEADQQRADNAERILRETGAVDIDRKPAYQQIDHNRWWLWLLSVVLILGVLGLAGGLVAYDILKLPWFSQMVHQAAVAYEQGPRLAAPDLAAPVQGPVLINDTTPASQPVASSPDSLQRGQILFSLHCAVCHGDTGEGNGRVSGFLNPKPANLTAAQVQGLTDDQIFIVITKGFGNMPSVRENLVPSERWDTVNWVRTLKK